MLFTPKEIVGNYTNIGARKTKLSEFNTVLSAILAGFLIACGAAVTNTAIHGFGNVGLGRVICGVLFPFGLTMVVISGAELFTGNCLICISVLEKKASVVQMIKNLVLVYVGNFIGSIIVAASCAFFGQLNYSKGALAVYTVQVAINKCSISFSSGVVLGILANVLVCMGVICSLAAKDVTGKFIGAFVAVSFFVICGFEHSIANMYYIPAGLFALNVPEYAELVKAAGIDTSMLTWGNFVLRNLVPVTIGNIIGGVSLGALLWKTNAESANKK